MKTLVLPCFALIFGLVYLASVNETLSLREKRSAFASGLVPENCLQCICELESKCRAIGCERTSNSESCGSFKIKESYYKDCGSPGSSWRACASDKYCASMCVQNYMKRYAANNRCPMTCESFARMHNGGPMGCFSSATEMYWSDRKANPGCSNL